MAIGVRIRLPAPPRSPDARQLLIYGLKNKRSGVDLRTENKYGHLPGSPGACRDGWDGILAAQLDYRTRPCNFVEIMPRLDEHLKRGKAKS